MSELALVLARAEYPLRGTEEPVNVAQTIAFGVIAAIMVFGALRVVTTRNVVHAAMWLVLVLAGAAAQFILLAAEFVGVTQVLVYIGAIVVLFLFGVMLTRANLGYDADLTRKNWYGGAFVGVVMLALLSWTMIDTFSDAKIPEERRAVLVGADRVSTGSNTSDVSDTIFSTYLIPFEVVGVLLTAALVGAIVIARKE